MLLSHNSSKIVNPRRLTSRTPKTKQTLLLEDNMLKRWLMLKTPWTRKLRTNKDKRSRL
jgi:hypothetical protein